MQIHLKVTGKLGEAIEDIIHKYHTDAPSLIRGYLVWLATTGYRPKGYPKRVVPESQATPADYEDENTLILPAGMTIRIPSSVYK